MLVLGCVVNHFPVGMLKRLGQEGKKVRMLSGWDPQLEVPQSREMTQRQEFDACIHTANAAEIGRLQKSEKDQWPKKLTNLISSNGVADPANSIRLADAAGEDVPVRIMYLGKVATEFLSIAALDEHQFPLRVLRLNKRSGPPSRADSIHQRNKRR